LLIADIFHATGLEFNH